MFYTFSHTVTTDDIVTVKKSLDMQMSVGVIHQVDVLFQDGCDHKVNVQVFMTSLQLWPSNRDAVMKGNATVISFMTCSVCGSLTGPQGLFGLVVRNWECSACGAQHDRDVNSAKVILNSGLGYSLDNTKTHTLIKPEILRLESSGGAR